MALDTIGIILFPVLWIFRKQYNLVCTGLVQINVFLNVYLRGFKNVETEEMKLFSGFMSHDT